MTRDKIATKTEKPKRKKRKSQFTWMFAILWASVFGLAFMLILGQVGRYNELREEYVILQENIANAQEIQRQLELAAEFHDANAHIERLARERLGFVRPNEIVFRNTAAD